MPGYGMMPLGSCRIIITWTKSLRSTGVGSGRDIHQVLFRGKEPGLIIGNESLQ